MGLFTVLFWCVAAASAILRHDSRFGVFNSRLGANKFPFSRQREFARKSLSSLVVFVTRRHFGRTIEKIPGSTGITGNCRSNRRMARGYHTACATVLSERARSTRASRRQRHGTARLRPVSLYPDQRPAQARMAR